MAKPERRDPRRSSAGAMIKLPNLFTAYAYVHFHHFSQCHQQSGHPPCRNSSFGIWLRCFRASAAWGKLAQLKGPFSAILVVSTKPLPVMEKTADGSILCLLV